MIILTNAIVCLVAILHFYFLILEMFLWTKPAGLRAFRQTPEKAEASKVLAANQGLYNGFLTAGLLWGVCHPNAEFGLQIKIFFLLCVVAAGVFGAYSVSRRILYFQALPAFIGLALLFLFR